MKTLFSLISLSIFAFAQVDVEGKLGLDTQINNKKINKDNTNFTLFQEAQFSYEKESLKALLKIYAQGDSKDIKNKKHDRSFIRVDEAYIKYEFEESEILLGKNIKFWGALELSNIVDTFNIHDNRNKTSKTDKIGAYNLTYSKYFDDSELNIITKFYEQHNQMAKQKYHYSFLNTNEKLSKDLKSKESLYRPTLYINYNGSLSDDITLDYAFIYQNGYDSQRYLSKNANTYFENIYLVDKFMTYNTLVLDSTLYKMELLYTHIKNEKNISDYVHMAIGVEHTLDALENGHEIGLISEYYYYDTLEDGKLTDVQLGQVFQDDLFLGFRYTLNNSSDTNAVGGIVFDTKYDEQTYYLELESRIFDTLKIKTDFRYIEPSSSHNTVFSQQGRSQEFGFKISYHY